MRFHPKLVEQLLKHIDRFVSEYAMNTSLTGTDKTSAYLRREAELEQDALIDWAHDTISREAANL